MKLTRASSGGLAGVVMLSVVATLVASCRSQDEDSGRPFPEFSPVLRTVGLGRPARIDATVLQGDRRLVAYAFDTGSGERYGAAIARHLATGELDTSFGDGGMTLLDLNASFFPDIAENRPIRMVLQSDGRILVGGTSYDGSSPATAEQFSNPVVYRLTVNGHLDETFGGGGRAYIPVARSVQLRGLALQADGKAVIAGMDWGGFVQSRVALARLNSDGLPDTSFGNQGVVTQDVAGGGAVFALTIGTLNGTERITLGGSPTGITPEFRRFLLDGQPDPSFGTGGLFRVELGRNGGTLASMVLQPDGKIVALGTRDDGQGPLLMRITPEGTLDTSFQGGRINPGLGLNHHWRALTLAPDGTLLAAGTNSINFVAAVYNPDGTLMQGGGSVLGAASTDGVLRVPGPDGTTDARLGTVALEPSANGQWRVVIGGSGQLRNHPNAILLEVDGNQSQPQLRWMGDSPFGLGLSFARGMAEQNNGAIVVAGSALRGRSRGVMVARFLANGVLDPLFGQGGAVFVDSDGGDDDGYAVRLQSDGKILVAGCGYRPGGGTVPLLARFNPNGTPDEGFNGTGVVSLPAEGFDACALGLEVQPDGKIVLAGYHGVPSGPGGRRPQYSVFLARIHEDGTPDQEFNTKARTPLVSSVVTEGRDLALNDDGTITVVGASSGELVVARFQEDGSPDPVKRYAVSGGTASVSAVRRTSEGMLLLAGAVTKRPFAMHTLLARLHPDGTLDTGFGGSPQPGMAVIDLGQNRYASSLLIDSQGRPVIPLSSATAGNDSDFEVARFDANGVLDTGFGVDGVLSTDALYADQALCVAERPDGRLLLAGAATDHRGIRGIALVLTPP